MSPVPPAGAVHVPTLEAPRAPDAPQAAKAAAAPVPVWSPVPTIDLALNVVVLDFLNDRGQVTRTLPTRQQLDAYQQARDARTFTVAQAA